MKSRVFVAFALCVLSGVTAAEEAVIAPQPGKAAVVIYRAARLDSFQVTTASGRGINREETEACGAKLAAKLGG